MSSHTSGQAKAKSKDPWVAKRLADLIELIPRRSLQTIAPSESFSTALAVARTVPARYVNNFGFEKRLGRDDARVDLAFNLNSSGVQRLCSLHPSSAIHEITPIWRRHSAPPHDGGIWLEFDTSNAHGDYRTPCVFFAFNRDGRLPAMTMVEQMLSIAIPDAKEKAEAADLLERCIQALPESARQLQLGFMMNRQTKFRVCAFFLSCKHLRKFLRAVADERDFTACDELIDSYGSLCDDLGVQVSRNADGSVAIAVELLSRHSPLEHRGARQNQWAAVLDQLVTDGRCDRSEQAAVLGWDGRTEFQVPVIERLLARLEDSEATVVSGTLHTFVNHIKVGFDQAQRVAAKAYLGAFLAAN